MMSCVLVTWNRCGIRTRISVIIGNDLSEPSTENYFGRSSVSTYNRRVHCDIL